MVDRQVDGQHAFSLIFFFDIFDGWSIVKLTGSMLVFDIFLRHVRWMVNPEVDWPMWVVLGRSWGLCVRSWVALGGLCWRSGGGLGTYVGDLEPLLGLCGWSWDGLAASLGGLGPLVAYVGGLGPLLGLCRRSWAALGAYLGGLGLLFGAAAGGPGSLLDLSWQS